MGGTSAKVARYRFGPFDLDPSEGTLSRNGVRVRLQDLPYRLLLMLVERPGEIVTREEVRQRLWPENTFVEFDNSLGVAIRKVRESLGDNAEAPQYVATVPRRGYRFLAPVSVQTLEQPPRVEPPPPAPVGVLSSHRDRAFPRRNLYWLVAGLLLLLLTTGAFFRFHFSPLHGSPKSVESVAAQVRLRRSVAVLGFRNLPGGRRTIGSRLFSRRCWTRNWVHMATCAWFRRKTLPG